MDRAARRRKEREHPVVQAPRGVPRARRRELLKIEKKRHLTGRPDPPKRQFWRQSTRRTLNPMPRPVGVPKYTWTTHWRVVDVEPTEQRQGELVPRPWGWTSLTRPDAATGDGTRSPALHDGAGRQVARQVRTGGHLHLCVPCRATLLV